METINHRRDRRSGGSTTRSITRQRKQAVDFLNSNLKSFSKQAGRLRLPVILLSFVLLTLLAVGGVARQAGGDDRFEVKITQGKAKSPVPFEGTHIASGEMSCSSTANDIWAANITVKKPSGNGLTEVLVMLTGVPASGGKTEEVNLGLTFGQLDDENGAVLGIGAAVGGGTGTGTVQRDGKGAVIKIEGFTHYGAAISAVVECKTVEVVR